MVEQTQNPSQPDALGRPQTVWRPGHNNIYLPFANLEETQQVVEQSKAKKLQFDVESFMDDKICEFAQHPNSTVQIKNIDGKGTETVARWMPITERVYFVKSKGFVKCVDLDEKEGTCVCQLQDSTDEDKADQTESVKFTLPVELLSTSIDLTFKSMTDQADGKAEIASLKINIDSPLLKQAEDLLGAAGIAFTGLACDDRLLKDDDTCLSLGLKNDQMILAQVGTGSGGGKLERWERSRKLLDISMSSGWYMSKDNWDSIKFTAQRRVKVCGYGVLGPVQREPPTPHGWKLTFRWIIDDSKSENYTFTSSDDTWDEEIKMHNCVFVEHDCEPFIIEEGQSFDFMQKYKEGPQTSHRYLNNGAEEGNEEQPKDFRAQSSSHDQNCTSTGQGQIPYLLYQPL